MKGILKYEQNHPMYVDLEDQNIEQSTNRKCTKIDKNTTKIWKKQNKQRIQKIRQISQSKDKKQNTKNKDNKQSKKNINKKKIFLSQPISYEQMVKNADNIIRKIMHDRLACMQNFEENSRKNYCPQILKSLIIGYQEFRQQCMMRKVLSFPPLSKTFNKFLYTYMTLQSCLDYLIAKSINIQNYLLLFFQPSPSTCLAHEPLKYKIQIQHLIRHLSDPYNLSFRQDILMGKLTQEDIAMMDQIDMMESRKREFIRSKRRSLLDYRQVQNARIQREERYRLLLSKMKANKNRCDIEDQQQAQNDMKGLDYYLSQKYVENWELSIMEIPMRDIRKSLLRNLTNTLL